MPKGKSDQNAGILEYALRHLEQERDEIQAKINHIQRQLGQRASAPAAAAAPAAAETSQPAGTRKKRTLSASARKRIALAQKKRWAEHRKAKGKE
jgi:hypothetical protein